MPHHILVIEDEPSVADNITYALETEGFTCSWKLTGAEGLALLEETDVHLVILDVGLPDTNGFEVCRTIRKDRDVPIIFLTARADEIDRVVGLEIGADDYVVKPFSPRELTARVKAILRRDRRNHRDEQKDANYVRPPFVVHEERFEISYFDVPLSLTRYEYRILEVMLHRPERVFSREQLMAQAWDEPEASMERTVDAHIKSIRAKLKQVAASSDVIRTHRGLGYSLQLPDMEEHSA